MRQVRAISHEWVRSKGGNERGFSMTLGRLPRPVDKDCELIVAQQKIGEKAWDGRTWVKFPPPAPGRYHVILTDMRGMAITGGDRYDYAQLAYGPEALAAENVPLAVRYNSELVRGLFEPSNNRLRSAAAVRQRIHFLGFCNDEDYHPVSLLRNSLYLPNPHLLPPEEATDALRHLPLRSPTPIRV